MAPEQLARGIVVASDQFLFAELFLRQRPSTNHCESRPGRADWLLPQKNRGLRYPIRIQSRRVQHRGAIGSEELRPIRGLGCSAGYGLGIGATAWLCVKPSAVYSGGTRQCGAPTPARFDDWEEIAAVTCDVIHSVSQGQ